MRKDQVKLEEEILVNDSGERKLIMVLTTTLGIKPLLSYMRFPKQMQSSLLNDTIRLTLECDNTMRGYGINCLRIEPLRICLDVSDCSWIGGETNYSKALILTYLKVLWQKLLTGEVSFILTTTKTHLSQSTCFCKSMTI